MIVPSFLGRCRDRDGSDANDRISKMEAETIKTGSHSPGSRSGTSRIVEQPEEYLIFFYSPHIIMPDTAEESDSAFIGGPFIHGNPGKDRAGTIREFVPLTKNPCIRLESRSGTKGLPFCRVLPGRYSCGMHPRTLSVRLRNGTSLIDRAGRGLS